MRGRRKAAALVLVSAALFAALFAFRTNLLMAAGTYLVQAERPQKADAVLVLAGDGRGNRIKAASELVRQGFVPVVLVSGPLETYGINEATLAIDYAVRSGYPRSWYDPVLIRAFSTETEAAAIAPELTRRKIRKLLLLTSNYHTRRSGEIFRRALPTNIEIHVVAAPDPYFQPNTWWQSREGQKTWFFEASKTFADWVGL